MRFAKLISRLRGLSPAAQGFWAGHEGVGRGRGPRLSSAPATVPTAKDIERAVEDGEMIGAGNR
jgi:hypothetical protein